MLLHALSTYFNFKASPTASTPAVASPPPTPPARIRTPVILGDPPAAQQHAAGIHDLDLPLAAVYPRELSPLSRESTPDADDVIMRDIQRALDAQYPPSPATMLGKKRALETDDEAPYPYLASPHALMLTLVEDRPRAAPEASTSRLKRARVSSPPPTKHPRSANSFYTRSPSPLLAYSRSSGSRRTGFPASSSSRRSVARSGNVAPSSPAPESPVLTRLASSPAPLPSPSSSSSSMTLPFSSPSTTAFSPTPTLSSPDLSLASPNIPFTLESNDAATFERIRVCELGIARDDDEISVDQPGKVWTAAIRARPGGVLLSQPQRNVIAIICALLWYDFLTTTLGRTMIITSKNRLPLWASALKALQGIRVCLSRVHAPSAELIAVNHVFVMTQKVAHEALYHGHPLLRTEFKYAEERLQRIVLDVADRTPQPSALFSGRRNLKAHARWATLAAPVDEIRQDMLYDICATLGLCDDTLLEDDEFSTMDLVASVAF